MGSRVIIDGIDTYTEIIFNTDSAGNTQRIMGHNIPGSGTSTDFDMHYDGFVDGGHVFTTASWPGPAKTTLATINYNGLTLNTNKAAIGMSLTAPGTDTFQWTLWAAGNGNGLSGVFGLYDVTRALLVWNTNSTGDIFFNTPMTPNVGAGTGAPARITAAGLIDGTAFSVAGTAGASGSYTTADSKTVTVTHGLITAIV
jgi:hypothetical protein